MRNLRRGTITLFVLTLSLPPAALADAPRYKDKVISSYLGTLEAAKAVAFRVKPAEGKIELVEATDNTQDADTKKAVARAPAWLRTQLREALRRMDAATRGPLVKVINGATSKTVDEIAFLVAHLAKEDLKVTTAEVIKRNAELIYEIDPQLKYADLVEKGAEGTDDSYYTTIKYKVKKDGKDSTFELPRDLYYWWVVHPRLDYEYATTIDPDKGSGAKPPTGVTWREFYLAKMEAAVTPRQHYILTIPNKIKQADLAAWNKGKHLAHGDLGPSEVGANEVVRAGKAGAGGAPVMVHFGMPGGSCNSTYPMADGIYLATTMPLEQIAAGGHPALLENFIMAGPARGGMRDYDMVSSSTQEKRKFLLVRDRIPFGLSKDPNEDAFKKYNRDYDVMTSTQFAALVDGGKLYSGGAGTKSCAKATDCATTEKCIGKVCLTVPLYNLTYNKIIVASDQPRALYMALNKRSTQLETFVKYSGTFQLHGATRAADDWSDLTMPGKIKSTKQDAAALLTEVHLYGNALLRDVMSGVDYLWDGVRRCSHVAKSICPKGDRKMKAGDDAMDRVGWWSGQMLDRSVGEWSCLRATKAQRSSYPQRIVRHHYGNCGEIQDVVGAASRAALIPSMLTYSVEDHVWNEFYAGDGLWYPYDTGWSDKPMRIGSWGVSGDGDSGGGKQNAVMVGWRGDGKPLNLLGRFKSKTTMTDGKIDYEYTRHLDLSIKVLDSNKVPVDGADVTLVTENYYWNHGKNPAYAKMAPKAISGTTGRDGVARFKVGDKRNFYVNVESALGAYPKALDHTKSYVSDIQSIKLLLPKASALADAKVDKEIVLQGADVMGKAYTQMKAAPKVTAVNAPKAGPGEAVPPRLRLQVDMVAEYRYPHHTVSRRHALESHAKGYADVYVTDEDNYKLFQQGSAFSAWVSNEQVSTSGVVTLDLPATVKEAVVIVSNKRRASFGLEVKADLALQEEDTTPVKPPEEDGDEDGGCGVAGGALAGQGAWTLLLLMLILVRRRKQ